MRGIQKREESVKRAEELCRLLQKKEEKMKKIEKLRRGLQRKGVRIVEVRDGFFKTLLEGGFAIPRPATILLDVVDGKVEVDNLLYVPLLGILCRVNGEWTLYWTKDEVKALMELVRENCRLCRIPIVGTLLLMWKTYSFLISQVAKIETT